MTPGIIWVGTSNGLIHVTRDGGKSWSDVTIPNLPIPRRANVSAIDASHHAAGTAYVAIEYLRGGDHTPYLFRTRDFGRTWTKIVTGLPTDEPSGSFMRVIREDTRKAGLLFTGSESGVYVSFDDGDHWQSLQQNLPNTPVRDLVIKDNDLIAGTHGRGIWILDDISTLRQLTPAIVAEAAHLFAPGTAIRVRRNVSADTPLPPEVPHALNPPDGAIIDYWLPAKPAGIIRLDVLDAAGGLVRHFSSAPIVPVPEAARPPHPDFWVATPAPMPTDVGTHRINWDLRRDPPPAFSHGFSINANPGLTPASPEGALVLPGVYTLKLTVDGKSLTQQVTVKNDPRSPASMLALRAQDSLLTRITTGLWASWDDDQETVALRTAVGAIATGSGAAEAVAAAKALLAAIDSVAGAGGGRGGRGGGAGVSPTFRGINGALASQLGAQDNADQAPTPSMRAALAATCHDLGTTQARWQQLITARLTGFNAVLSRNGMPVVTAPKAGVARAGC